MSHYHHPDGVEGIEPPSLLSCSDVENEVYEGKTSQFFLTQTCGLPLISLYRATFKVLGIPCYSAEGCTGPMYSSAIVVAKDSALNSIDSLQGLVVARNSVHSCSGTLLCAAALGPVFQTCKALLTGGHEASLAAVASGQAAAATIDCVTFELLKKHRSAALQNIKVIGYTPQAPALPYVVPISMPEPVVMALRKAVTDALADSDPGVVAAREALLLADMDFTGEHTEHNWYEEHLLPLRKSISRQPVLPLEPFDQGILSKDAQYLQTLLAHVKTVSSTPNPPHWDTLSGNRQVRTYMPAGGDVVQQALQGKTAKHPVGFVAFLGTALGEGQVGSDHHKLVVTVVLRVWLTMARFTKSLRLTTSL